MDLYFDPELILKERDFTYAEFKDRVKWLENVLDDYYKDNKPACSNQDTRCNDGNSGRYRQDLFHWRTIPWVNIIRN